MFAIIGGFTDQQRQHGQQDLLAQVGAITVGQRFVLTSKVTEEHDDLHEHATDVERRGHENVFSESARRIQESVLCEPSTDDSRVADMRTDGFEPGVRDGISTGRWELVSFGHLTTQLLRHEASSSFGNQTGIGTAMQAGSTAAKALRSSVTVDEIAQCDLRDHK